MNIKKHNEKELSVSQDPAIYSADFIDQQVEICQATVASTTAELKKWLDLQAKKTEFGLK